MNDLPSPDPVRQAVIDGLARRAAALHGDARQQVMQRLQRLLDEPASAGPGSERPAIDALQRPAALAGLSALVDRLGRSPAVAAIQTTPQAASLKAVTAFRHTWSRLRAEQRLRQALAQVPAQAGPLNSSQVVHRALQAMHDLSPAYLDAVLSQLETLMALELSAGLADPLPPPRPAPRRDGQRRPGARPGRKS